MAETDLEKINRLGLAFYPSSITGLSDRILKEYDRLYREAERAYEKNPMSDYETLTSRAQQIVASSSAASREISEATRQIELEWERIRSVVQQIQSNGIPEEEQDAIAVITESIDNIIGWREYIAKKRQLQ